MRRARAAACAIAALLASLGASAADSACPPEAPAYKFLRFDESYTYLKRPECPVDDFDAIKFRSLGIGDARISFGADFRVRMPLAQFDAWRAARAGRPVLARSVSA